MISGEVEKHASLLSLAGTGLLEFKKNIVNILEGKLKDIVPEFDFSYELKDQIWVKTFMKNQLAKNIAKFS